MNALTKIENTALSTMTEAELCNVLQTSLYPGASLDSIKMVLGYCKASSLDPMRKPVHIVPMWDGKTKQMRDVVMPGVGLYRTDASRTGEHVGTDKPVYGPMVEYELSGVKICVPEWCAVTVYRLKNGIKCAYTAEEYWIENYATAGKDTTAPNSMWRKRARGQLAKCAEAQALRKAFPEVGSAPTADEMEGKTIDMGMVESVGPQVPPEPPKLPEFTTEHLTQRAAKIADFYAAGKSADQIIAFYATKASLSDAICKAIRDMAPAPNAMTYAQVADELSKAADRDSLDIAADLIKQVADLGQRDELSGIYGQRREAIEAAN